MRPTAIRILFVLVLLAAACGGADAKWWIFGKSDEPVDFHYLYINNMSFLEKSEKITLFRDSLPDGRVTIRGKAKTKAGKVGSVEVSLDNRETWQKAKLGESGAFEFSFRPELGKSYDLYIKVLDTTGKSNKIEDTYRQITLSDRDLMAAVREALQKLVDAYCQENPSAFMALVSDDFAGDAVLLDRAIRKDFTAFDQIDLRFNISSVASGAKGRIYVSLLYNRFMLSARSGASFTDKGTTEFVFEQKDDGLLVWSMKNPLIFGLSDAGNVATGTVYTGGNDNIIVVDEVGNVRQVPFEEGINIIAGGGGGGGAGDFAGLSNLRVTGGGKRHFVDLEFDTILDWSTMPAGTYETVVEESLSPGGPWTEVERKDLDTFVRVMSDRIAQQSVMLYYRVRIQRLADGLLSQPSNVVQWDNT